MLVKDHRKGVARSGVCCGWRGGGKLTCMSTCIVTLCAAVDDAGVPATPVPCATVSHGALPPEIRTPQCNTADRRGCSVVNGTSKA